MRLSHWAVCLVFVALNVLGWQIAFAQTSGALQAPANGGVDTLKIKDLFDIASKTVTMLATIFAGLWAYYRFVKGRVYKPRLTLTVTARRIRIDKLECVVSTVELANVGLSRVGIKVADLRVSKLNKKTTEQEAYIAESSWMLTERILLAHSYIESGEKITEQIMFIVNTDAPIVLNFRVTSNDVSFTATTIAEPPEGQALRP